MTPQQQRIAIAEACGWKFQPLRPDDGLPGWQQMKQEAIMCWIRPGNPEWQTEQIPDYLNDLNAANDAESVLFPSKVHQLNGPDKWAEYKARLEIKCVGHPGGAIRATAAQRCECLVKTLGKWVENSP